jgi:hypothetical protein
MVLVIPVSVSLGEVLSETNVNNPPKSEEGED